MKVLILTDYGRRNGGVEEGTALLRDGLKARGVNVRVLASSAWSCAPVYADEMCLGTTSRWRTLLQTFNPWAVAKLRRVLYEFSPDVVHVKMFLTQLSPAILPLLAGRPVLHHVEWLRCLCPIGSKRLPDGSACHFPWGLACLRQGCLPIYDWLALMAQMKAFQKLQHVFRERVACSESLARALESAGLGPVSVIPNGIPSRPLRALDFELPVIAWVGRMVFEKGPDILIRAFAQVQREHPLVRLLLVGDGPQRPQLEDLVKDLQVRDSVEFAGYLDRQTLEEALECAWIVAIPSRVPEGMPLVACEAMMRGNVLVASSRGGLVDLLADSARGVLVRSEDPRDWAAILAELLGEPERIERIAREAYNFALKNLTAEQFVERFLKKYRELAV